MEEKDRLIFESAFGGGNRSIQLNVRISPELNEALEAESQRSNQPIPDLVREWVAFRLYPGFLKNKLDEGIEIDSKDRTLLGGYRKALDKLAGICGEINEEREKLQTKRFRKDYKGKIIEEAAQEIITKLFGSEREFRRFKARINKQKGDTK